MCFCYCCILLMCSIVRLCEDFMKTITDLPRFSAIVCVTSTLTQIVDTRSYAQHKNQWLTHVIHFVNQLFSMLSEIMNVCSYFMARCSNKFHQLAYINNINISPLISIIRMGYILLDSLLNNTTMFALDFFLSKLFWGCFSKQCPCF